MKWIIVGASVLAATAAVATIAFALAAEFPSDEQQALDACTVLAGVEIIDPVIAQRGSSHRVSGSIDLGRGPVPFDCDATVTTDSVSASATLSSSSSPVAAP